MIVDRARQGGALPAGNYRRQSGAFLFRTTGRVFRRRTIGAVVLLVLIPVALAVPALAALALVSGVCSLVVVYEVIRHREDRLRIRHPELPA